MSMLRMPIWQVGLFLFLCTNLAADANAQEPGGGTSQIPESTCGSRYLPISTTVYASFESEVKDVVDELEAEGAPDGLFARIYSNNEILVLDLGETFIAGTQYEITWRRRNTGSPQPAVMDLSESINPASAFTTHFFPIVNFNASSFTTTTVTSLVDFRYLRFRKGNSVGYQLDAVAVNSIQCVLDSDEDAVMNSIDKDDDNDGILDGDEADCASVEAYWTFDNSFNDASGNGHHRNGTTDAPSFSTDAIQGSHSVNFNGTNHKIRYSQNNTFMESSYNQISFSVWLKPSNVNGTRVVYEEGGSSNGFTLWLENGVPIITARAGGVTSETSVRSSNALIPNQNWYHLAAVFDKGLMILYVDGIAYSVTASFNSIPAHSGDGGLGGVFTRTSAEVTGNYAGLMDAAKYSYTTAWLGSEIDFNCDADLDGLSNITDLDSDNDGIGDIVECNGVDSNNDGCVDVFLDTDADGYANLFDPDNSGTQLSAMDTDDDGIDNRWDLDSDNDGIPDIVEAGGVDINEDGRVDASIDTDLDGYADVFDTDNGGIALIDGDTDFDGVIDRFDLDADNDGIADLLELGGTDANLDGVADSPVDADNDGWSSDFDADEGGTALMIQDTDGDGLYNHNDIDADNDGLVDNIEAQSTGSFIALSGLDTDNDGWDDSYDSDNGGSAFGLNNQDAIGSPDFLSLDTDNDGLEDWIEAFDVNKSGDALDDAISKATSFEESASNPNYYVNTNDADLDGMPDWIEDDNSNNLPNFLDPSHPLYIDTDADGLVDLFDPDNFGTSSSLPDANSDGLPDFRDFSSIITLPVELDYFVARKQTDVAYLEWITLTEVNNDHFEIERSSDGLNYSKIGELKGNGNSNDRILYTFTDFNPLQGANYYRLKQIDYDGKMTIEGIRWLDYEIASNDQVKIYPNPSNGSIVYLEFIAEVPSTRIQILNSSARTIYNRVIDGNIGEYQLLRIDLGGSLSAGYYIVQIDGIEVKRIKLVIH